MPSFKRAQYKVFSTIPKGFFIVGIIASAISGYFEFLVLDGLIGGFSEYGFILSFATVFTFEVSKISAVYLAKKHGAFAYKMLSICTISLSFLATLFFTFKELHNPNYEEALSKFKQEKEASFARTEKTLDEDLQSQQKYWNGHFSSEIDRVSTLKESNWSGFSELQKQEKEKNKKLYSLRQERDGKIRQLRKDKSDEIANLYSGVYTGMELEGEKRIQTEYEKTIQAVKSEYRTLIANSKNSYSQKISQLESEFNQWEKDNRKKIEDLKEQQKNTASSIISQNSTDKKTARTNTENAIEQSAFELRFSPESDNKFISATLTVLRLDQGYSRLDYITSVFLITVLMSLILELTIFCAFNDLAKTHGDRFELEEEEEFEREEFQRKKGEFKTKTKAFEDLMNHKTMFQGVGLRLYCEELSEEAQSLISEIKVWFKEFFERKNKGLVLNEENQPS